MPRTEPWAGLLCCSWDAVARRLPVLTSAWQYQRPRLPCSSSCSEDHLHMYSSSSEQTFESTGQQMCWKGQGSLQHAAEDF
jgi:hypothetical protein